VCPEKGRSQSYNQISSSVHYPLLTLETAVFLINPYCFGISTIFKSSPPPPSHPVTLKTTFFPQTFYVTENFVSSQTHLQHPRKPQSVTLKTGAVLSSQKAATFTYYKVRYSNLITGLNRP
jgi:hypothetical protein